MCIRDRFKYQPAVIARAETNGIFIAQNLKPIPYRVYALSLIHILAIS